MLTLSLSELLAYTDEERGRWRGWLVEHPAAMALQLQPGGRFATVGALIDHIFLVETRHLARLEGRLVPEASGVAANDIDALFAYAAKTRDGLRAYASKLDEIDAIKPRSFTVQSGKVTMTPRKLLLHIGLHEIRHWAQIALGVRQAGMPPPGNHDLFYSTALE
jgi:uncharacterized damage-inducible protein DinB